MNFQTEAANLERFHALNQDVVFVTSPILYRAYTTTNVLVMERIDGMGIDEHDKLVEAGYDLAEIGAKLADNYVRQIMEDGFFHADPHPGNIRIRDGKIVWLDMGMMGSLNEKERKLIGNAILPLCATRCWGWASSTARRTKSSSTATLRPCWISTARRIWARWTWRKCSRT